MKSPRMNPKLLAAWALLCVAFGSLLSALSGMPFWGAAAVVATALIVNGVIADNEDRWPGGFFNPRGKSK